MAKSLISNILSLLCITFSAHAGMYRWVDENGIKHFSNTGAPIKTQVEKKPEVESQKIPTPTKSSKSYQKSVLRYQPTYKAKQPASTSSKSTKSYNSGMRDYYKNQVESYERWVNVYKKTP